MSGFFLFVVLFFSASLCGMELEKSPFKFSVMTYNVCNFYGMATQKNAAHITWEKRKDRIFTLILDEKPDIIGFQELRDDCGNSTIKDLWNGLSSHGYAIESFRHSPCEDSYINAIAYNEKKFALQRKDNWWLSETPYVYSCMHDECFGNAVLMLLLYPRLATKKWKNDSTAYSYDYGCPIYIANVHNSTRYNIKMQTNKVLVDEIKRRTEYSKGIVVTTGDFNTLVEFDQKSINELAILKDAGYKEILDKLITKNGILVWGTFNGYSCDRYQCPKGTLSGQLDHIFLKTLSDDITYESQSHVNVKRYNGNDNEKATTQAELLAGLDGQENRDEFPSDHIPGIVELVVHFNKK